jgi:hypothetical protein
MGIALASVAMADVVMTIVTARTEPQMRRIATGAKMTLVAENNARKNEISMP